MLIDASVRGGVLLLSAGNAGDMTPSGAALVEAPSRARRFGSVKTQDADRPRWSTDSENYSARPLLARPQALNAPRQASLPGALAHQGDLPPPKGSPPYRKTQRWLCADSFAAVAGAQWAALRIVAEREPEPSAVILDSRTLRSSPESSERAGYDGAKRKRGSKVHLAVDTPGHVVALQVTPAVVDNRTEPAYDKLARRYASAVTLAAELAV